MPLNVEYLSGKSLGAVYEKETGHYAVLMRTPFRIGRGRDFQPKGDGWERGGISVTQDGGRAKLEAGGVTFRVNGKLVTFYFLEEEEACHVSCGGSTLIVYWGKRGKEWVERVLSATAVSGDSGGKTRTMTLAPMRLKRRGEWENGVAAGKGFGADSEPFWSNEDSSSAGQPMVTPGDSGEFTCPHCWLRFDLGDVKHLSVHEDLRGDPILGRDAPQRFHAVRFNHLGQALDAMGVACHEIACPHCHHKLHPGFIDLPHKIYSIVGAPSAGKSYFLAAMVGVVQERLAQWFRVALKDADPTGNATLNDMKAKLFGAGTPEEAVLLKTQLDGEMYQVVMRHGHRVAMPRPFVFTLVHPKRGATHGLVFYDNAGENFEPGMELDEQPGAQHVAHSEAILFLFDPTTNQPFRQKLEGHPDPQLSMRERLNQQDVLLAELDARLRKLKGMRSKERWDRPLLFLVGKSDVWMPMFLQQNAQRWKPTERRDGGLDVSAVVSNSDLLREFLSSICPQVVALVEGLSAEVRYFPVSALGHSPLVLPDGRLAPDPERVQPQGVADPILWVLSRLPGWEFLAGNEG